jgi:hypothetical protein
MWRDMSLPDDVSATLYAGGVPGEAGRGTVLTIMDGRRWLASLPEVGGYAD